MKVHLRDRFNRIRKFVAHPALPQEKLERLSELAGSEEQKPFRWRDGDSLSLAHNAHYTNTPEELQKGLQGNFNFLEGDVWLEGAVRQIPLLDRFREPIMAHDPTAVDGLSLAEWLEIAKRSGKGVKLDIKQSAAIEKLIETVRRSGIPEQRLVFNADVVFGPGMDNSPKLRALDVLTDFRSDTEEMLSLRRAFPKATIALGLYTAQQPQGTRYKPEQLASVIDMACQIGGPITFPLRAEFVDEQTVRTLKPYGSVSIWNDPRSYLPDDLEAEKKRFREMGVDGMIDLRDSNSLQIRR